MVRVGEVLRHPTITGTVGIATATAITTGVTLGAQYAYDDHFHSAQDKPGAANHWVGLGGAAIGGISAITFGIRNSDLSRPVGGPVGFGLGFGVGALTGAYLVAPIVRRLDSEG